MISYDHVTLKLLNQINNLRTPDSLDHATSSPTYTVSEQHSWHKKRDATEISIVLKSLSLIDLSVGHPWNLTSLLVPLSVHDNSRKIPEQKQTLMALSQKVCKHYRWTDYVTTEQVPGTTTAESSELVSVYQLLVSPLRLTLYTEVTDTQPKQTLDRSTPHWSFSFSWYQCQTAFISTIICICLM